MPIGTAGPVNVPAAPTVAPITAPQLVGAGLLGGGLAAGGVLGASALAGSGLAPALGLPILASPAGALLVAGLGILALRKALDLGWINSRPQPQIVPAAQGDVVRFPSGGNRSFTATYTRQTNQSASIFCPTGAPSSPASVGTPVEFSTGLFGIGVRVGQQVLTSESRCGTGTNIPGASTMVYEVVTAGGGTGFFVDSSSGGVSFGGLFAGTTTTIYGGIRISSGGVTLFGDRLEPLPLTPQTVPRLPPIPVLPETNEDLERERLLPPVPVLPPPPAGDPVPRPQVVPRPGQAPAPAPGPRPSPAPAPRPSPGPARVPGTSPGPADPAIVPAPRPVRPTAPQPSGTPAPIPQTPPTVVFYPDVVVGQPGSSPQPTLEGIAQEVGRLEGKMKALLDRPSFEKPDFGELLEDLEDLLKPVLDDKPGGQYELFPACPGASGEDPPDPVVVSWSSSDDPIVDLRKRLDALALLIQAHKDLGQPSCTTRITGRPVTVTFESDPL